jgi:hypothetical protein
VNPPTVLLERSFVAALADSADPRHAAATHCYLELVDEFSRDERLLAVTSDTRRDLAATTGGLLAPVDTLHVAGQERHAAEHVRIDGLGAGADPAHDDLALILVLLRRHGIPTIATFDHRYDDFDVEVLPGRTA